MRKVAVVGAGLAGLTAATYLSGKNLDVTVYESSDRVGGRVTSDNINGYICDRGFQVINPNYSEIKKLNLMNGLDFSHISPNIQIDGINYGLNHPFNLIKNFPKLNTRVINPFLKGVFLTDPANVDSKIAAEIKRSFILGRPGVPQFGVSKFSEKLAANLKIKLNSSVKSIKSGRVLGVSIDENYDAVIVAVDPRSATKLTEFKNYEKVLPSTTWYHSVKGLVLDSDYLRIKRNGKLVNSVVISNVSKSYAPQGYSLISSTSLENLSENDLKSELRNMWGSQSSDWDLVSKFEIANSLPLRRDSKKIDPRIGEKLYIAGDHVDVPSQNGAMRSGRRAAEAVIADLKLN